MLQPIDAGIFFVFVDHTTHTSFVNRTQAGIVFAKDTGAQANIPRWGTVISVGKDVATVQPADYVLIEPGMWTPSFDTDGIRLWKTEEAKVLAISDEVPDYNY